MAQGTQSEGAWAVIVKVAMWDSDGGQKVKIAEDEVRRSHYRKRENADTAARGPWGKDKSAHVEYDPDHRGPVLD